ncbi:hypothetical protein [Streptomyces sp. NPDC006012]|uniref:hypothetical protein n=1 Tax=Streptomyces sp. NPDC006012 TaxID=3364739 RepID=UPI00369B0B55
MSGNIKIQWNGLADATHDMQVLTANMRQAMEELVAGVEALNNAAQGNSGDSWRLVKDQLNNAINQMDSAFNQGHQTLTNMSDTHQAHDCRGATVMQPVL